MTIKRALKILFQIIFGFILFVSLYVSLALILSFIGISAETKTSADVEIHILTNGDHTDIVVPAKNGQMDWSRQIRYDNTISKDTTGKYLALGWGDKGFYLNTPAWSQLKFSVAFKAAFALSTSAIHATYYNELHEGADCKKIMISNEQYKRLIDYVEASFKRDASGNIVNIKTTAQYGTHDAFYDAKRKYNLFYTCNTWANSALKACGQKACLWTPFDKGIFYKYRDK